MKNIQKMIKPVNPAAAYIGGKRLLSKQLIEMIKTIPHTCYAEPFFGMGGVFFRRDIQAQSEIINDISKEVTNFLKIIQRHFVSFVDFMKWHVTTRQEFERLAALDPETLTDIERAARFLYLQRLAFGGKATNQNYGYSPTTPARFNITKIESNLSDIHNRLSAVQIENLGYEAFIKKYDRPTTLFYLDPPYYNNENDYGKDIFSKNDFIILANLLAKIKGKFILSLNDVPEIRKIFKAFAIASVLVRYSLSGGNRSIKAKEVIISSK